MGKKRKSTAARSPVKEFIPSTIPRLGMPSVGSSSSFFDGHADTPPPYTAKVSSGGELDFNLVSQ